MVFALIALAAAQQFTVERAPEWDALFERSSGWAGADGVFAIPLDGDDRPDGLARTDTLFFFSDTFVGTVLPNGERRDTVMINNSVALLPRGGFPAGMRFWYPEAGGAPQSVFTPQTPLARPGEWYWPHDGVVVSGSLKFLAHRFERSAQGMGFRRVGAALIELPPGSRPPFAGATQTDFPFWLPETAQRSEMVFGAGILANTAEAGAPRPDGFVYVYGVREDPFVKKLLCARVAPDRFASFADWRFWDGSSWQPDPERSAVLAGRVAPELSVSPLPDGRFLLVHQLDTIGDRIVVRVGATPVGPFEPFVEVYRCPLPDQPELWTYNAKAHPHLSGPRELLISYHMNAVEFREHFEHAEIYRPRFIRLKW